MKSWKPPYMVKTMAARANFNLWLRLTRKNVVVFAGNGETMKLGDGVGPGIVAEVHSRRLYGDMQG